VGDRWRYFGVREPFLRQWSPMEWNASSSLEERRSCPVGAKGATLQRLGQIVVVFVAGFDVVDLAFGGFGRCGRRAFSPELKPKHSVHVRT
jgi:hypothetical protein